MRRKSLPLFLSKVMLAFFTLFALSFYSCQNEDMIVSGDSLETVELRSNKITVGNVTSEILSEFSISDLLSMKSHLSAAGIDISGLSLPQSEVSQSGLISDILLSAVKVSVKSQHPADPTREINLSGVLLVPKLSLTSLRVVVAPVPTFTADSHAPSNLFADKISLIANGGLNYLYFWSLQAYQGFAVLLPDYPGFGDSYQECFIPYVVKQPMIQASIDLTKATQTAMTSRGYRYKSDLIITGYSQGAFVATSFARELELNPSHGLSVNLLVSGGTPANLVEVIDAVTESEDFDSPYLVPYAACGFHSNGYPDMDFSNIFNEPYASKLYSIFDGTHTSLKDSFPAAASELFTPGFIQNGDPVVTRALNENTIQPWANQCRMVMIHGGLDSTVAYDNAVNFAGQQNAMGGNVEFHTVLGNHVTSIIQYYLYASTNLLFYK